MFGSKQGKEERLEQEVALLEQEALSPAQIAERLNVPRSTVTRDLPVLEDRGVFLQEAEERGGILAERSARAISNCEIVRQNVVSTSFVWLWRAHHTALDGGFSPRPTGCVRTSARIRSVRSRVPAPARATSASTVAPPHVPTGVSHATRRAFSGRAFLAIPSPGVPYVW